MKHTLGQRGACLWKAFFCLCVLVSAGGCGQEEAAQPSGAEEPATTAVSFREVTTEAGLGAFRHVNGALGEKWFPETMGAGGGFLDYDGDGWQDVVLVGGGSWDPETDRQVRKLWLYRNKGDGTFALASSQAGLDNLPGYGFGVVAADYDNDGDDDLYFTTLGPNLLLRNEGGVFQDVTQAAGLSGVEEWSTSAIFFDADRDGWLDLYVGNYVVWTPDEDLWCSFDGENKGYCTPELYRGVPGRYYRNRGDGTFEEQTDAAGFSTGGKTLGVAELDYNDDGWPDLAVANDTDPDQLFQNDGDGTFSEVGVVSGMAFDERGRARAGMGIDAGVVDETGRETIFVGNFSNQMIGVYRYAGNGLFEDRAAASQIGRTSLLTLTFGLVLFDADLDGDLDLYAANGHVQPYIEQVKDNVTFRQPSHLFLNLGDGTFEDAAPRVGGALADSLVGRGAAYADFDNDGDLDLLVTENAGPAHLLRNDLNEGVHYLRVEVQGRQSNRDGIGTRLVAVVGTQRQVRRIRTGSSFLSQSEKVATFGLKGADRVDSLLVYWPGGLVDRFADVAADQTVVLVEGERRLSTY